MQTVVLFPFRYLSFDRPKGRLAARTRPPEFVRPADMVKSLKALQGVLGTLIGTNGRPAGRLPALKQTPYATSPT